MCGIAGYLSKRDDPEPVGRIMLDMLTSLARRGPDSAGHGALPQRAGPSRQLLDPAARERRRARPMSAADPRRAGHDRRGRRRSSVTTGCSASSSRRRPMPTTDPGRRRARLGRCRGRQPRRASWSWSSRSAIRTTSSAPFDVERVPRQPRHRAHASLDREPGGPDPLAAVLGARRGRRRDRPQRPHHQLPQAPPAVRAARGALLLGERLRGHRRLHRRPAATAACRWRSALEASLDDFDGSFIVPRGQRRRDRATPATRSRSSRSSRSRPTTTSRSRTRRWRSARRSVVPVSPTSRPATSRELWRRTDCRPRPSPWLHDRRDAAGPSVEIDAPRTARSARSTEAIRAALADGIAVTVRDARRPTQPGRRAAHPRRRSTFDGSVGYYCGGMSDGATSASAAAPGGAWPRGMLSGTVDRRRQRRQQRGGVDPWRHGRRPRRLRGARRRLDEGRSTADRAATPAT